MYKVIKFQKIVIEIDDVMINEILLDIFFYLDDIWIKIYIRSILMFFLNSENKKKNNFQLVLKNEM